MRVLFHLPYPGYHRLYGSTVRLLAERGNTVLLAYDSEKQRSPAAERVEHTPGVEIVAPVPRRDDALSTLATRLRIGADYLRYLGPGFSQSDWLRDRMKQYLPEGLGFLGDVPTLNGGVDGVLAYLRSLEEALPSDPAIDRYLEALSLDGVVVSPVLARGRSGVHQRDTVKSARTLGIPVGVGVASWDHLTSKGVIGELPDALYVWNDAQKIEAIELHGVPSERILVTGAQAFDQWFDREADLSRQDFLEDVGLSSERRYLLYVGSSPNISPVDRERAIVRRWAEALRRCPYPELREAGVLIRPHPGNVAGWSDADLSDLGEVIVSPRTRPDIVMGEEEEAHYFHTLYYADAVVGVNTSAMIEAAIVGRAIHTFLTPEFGATQAGTPHFHLLTPEAGGCLRIAQSLDDHFSQLDDAIRQPEQIRPALDKFVASFVRPKGRERPATRVLAKAIERLAG